MRRKKIWIKNKIWHFLAIVLVISLILSIIDSIRIRQKLELIEAQIDRRVKEKVKAYEKNLQSYRKEIEQYKKLYERTKKEIDYYRKAFRKLQVEKEKIELPKTSQELRERFEALGYPPIN